MSYPQSDRSHKYSSQVRKALKTLLTGTADPTTMTERRSVVDGVTRVEKELMGEVRAVESDHREVAKFTLQEFLAEDDLISEIMRMPESPRRQQQRIVDWKRGKKPCPAGCDEGRIQEMDGWMRCGVCGGKGWVI